MQGRMSETALQSTPCLVLVLSRLYGPRAQFPDKQLIHYAESFRVAGHTGCIDSIFDPINTYDRALKFLLSIESNAFDPRADGFLRRLHRAWTANVSYRNGSKQAYDDCHVTLEHVRERLGKVTHIFHGAPPKNHPFPGLFDRTCAGSVWCPVGASARLPRNHELAPFFVGDEPLPFTSYGVHFVHCDVVRPTSWDDLEIVLRMMISTLTSTFVPTLECETPVKTASLIEVGVQELVGMFEERMRRADAMFADAACMEAALVRNAVNDQNRVNETKALLADAEVKRADANFELLIVSETLERCKTVSTSKKCSASGKKSLAHARDELKRTKQELKACISSVEHLQRERDEAMEAVSKANAVAERARELESQLVEAKTEITALRDALDSALESTACEAVPCDHAVRIEVGTQATPGPVFENENEAKYAAEALFEWVLGRSSAC